MAGYAALSGPHGSSGSTSGGGGDAGLTRVGRQLEGEGGLSARELVARLGGQHDVTVDDLDRVLVGLGNLRERDVVRAARIDRLDRRRSDLGERAVDELLVARLLVADGVADRDGVLGVGERPREGHPRPSP